MRTTSIKSIFTLIFMLGLTSCVSLKLPNTDKTKFKAQPRTTRAAQLKKINQWDISGAFSIRYNKKAELANYRWKEKNATYSLLISSALNLYTISIDGTPSQVTLQESKQKTLRAHSPEALLTKRLGWSIPISNLKYWIRGLAAPGVSTREYDKYGHLISLHQQGWSVLISNYTDVSGNDLPRTLNITGHNLKVKLVIKKWSVKA